MLPRRIYLLVEVAELWSIDTRLPTVQEKA